MGSLAQLRQLLDLAAHAVVGGQVETLPLSHVQQALRRVESGHAALRVVVSTELS